MGLEGDARCGKEKVHVFCFFDPPGHSIEKLPLSPLCFGRVMETTRQKRAETILRWAAISLGVLIVLGIVLIERAFTVVPAPPAQHRAVITDNAYDLGWSVDHSNAELNKVLAYYQKHPLTVPMLRSRVPWHIFVPGDVLGIDWSEPPADTDAQLNSPNMIKYGQGVSLTAADVRELARRREELLRLGVPLK